MSSVHLSNLAKAYGVQPVIRDFSLNIQDGEFIALLGPSGCGKTTVLRMIAGFVQPDTGEIRFGKVDVTREPARTRNTALVFQRYALFPHMTVADNVAFGLRMRGITGRDRAARVRAALDLVRLNGLDARYPRQLSGGQQQRVALARALVVEPDVLLLDEPLSNLDARLRASIREEIHQLQRQTGLTTVLVTHDQEEALALADRLVVLGEGRIQQVGPPDNVYAKPVSRYVAEFLGQINIFEGHAAHGVFTTKAGTTFIAPALRDGSLSVGVRPERVVLSDAASPPRQIEAGVVLTVRVSRMGFSGAFVEVYAQTQMGETIVARLLNDRRQQTPSWQAGTTLHAAFQLEDLIHLH